MTTPKPPACTSSTPCDDNRRCWACYAAEALDLGVDVLTVMFAVRGERQKPKAPKPGDSGPTKGSG